MRKIILIVVMVAGVGLGWGDSTGTVNGEGKLGKVKKVLILQIIEENWDNLEFYLPKYLKEDKESSGTNPITKKDAIRPFEDLKKDIKTKNEKIIKSIKQSFKFSISKKNIFQNAEVYVRHEIQYYGKTYQLKEDETFIKDAFRFDNVHFNYSYEKVPKKISLLTDLTNNPYSALWSNFKHIRLVDDIYILSSEAGNLKIQYKDKNYTLEVGAMLELPLNESILTRSEMKDFKKYYEEKWGVKIKSMGEGAISSPKESFNFMTKITIVNYGYVDVEDN